MRAAALIGDAVVITGLTIVGFATHETLGQVGRLVVTVVAFLLAWAFVAPWFGVFDPTTLVTASKVWLVFLAWIAAAPLGAVLRGLVLSIDVAPMFVVVMAVVTGAGLVVWRLILAWFG
jgi:hypothetical protein